MVGLYIHKENPSDIMTKSVSPAEQFIRMRDIINGSNPVMFVSYKVKELCDSMSVSAGSILSIDVELEIDLECDLDGSNMEIDLECDLDGSNIEIEFYGIL